MRDYALGTTFDVKFTTRRFTTGVPFTLAGTPAVAAYPDNSTTEITAGITLTVDFDARTGLNNVRVVATSGNGYAAGSNYALVITAGTVDSVSVVGEVIGEFSIEAQSALRPTVAGRTLDVSAGGEAGVDLDNTAGTLAKGTDLTGFNDLDATGVRTAVGLATANMDTQLATIAGYIDTEVAAILAAVDTEVAAIKAKTDQLAFTAANQVDANALAWAGAATATNDVALVAAPTNFAAIAIDASGNVASDLKEINGDATAAANVAKTTRAIRRGTVGVAATTTSIPTSAFTPAGAAADQFKGGIITFDADTATAALRGQSTDITASTNAATPTLTVTALTTAPASGDTFSVT